MIQSKRLRPIMLATALALASFSVMAQTAEELFQKAEAMNREAQDLMELEARDVPGSNTYWVEKDRKQFAQGEALIEESLKLYKEAANKGHAQAEKAFWTTKSTLAEIYYNLCEIRDAFKLNPLLIELSEQNVDVKVKASALFKRGLLSRNGNCARKDDLKALEFYGQACDLGHMTACSNYSFMSNEHP